MNPVQREALWLAALLLALTALRLLETIPVQPPPKTGWRFRLPWRRWWARFRAALRAPVGARTVPPALSFVRFAPAHCAVCGAPLAADALVVRRTIGEAELFACVDCAVLIRQPDGTVHTLAGDVLRTDANGGVLAAVHEMTVVLTPAEWIDVERTVV